MNATDFDAVTIDAYGTLVTLIDPVPELAAALAERGVELEREDVTRAFRTEVAYYSEHSSRGHDEVGLALLQRDCAHVFLEAAGADLDAEEFAPVYAGAMRFELLPGVFDALERLRALGLELAVVGNWDLTLHRLLREIGVIHYFRRVVHASAKPSPDALLRVLTELGIAPERGLHIGDDEVDELAARAAGMSFAPAPLAGAVARLV